jgi:hypothetical protein
VEQLAAEQGIGNAQLEAAKPLLSIRAPFASMAFLTFVTRCRP